MKKYEWSQVILLSLFLASCGREGVISKKTVIIPEEKVDQLLENQNFECASSSGAPCPEGLARVFVFNKEDPKLSTVCSGFLNGNDRIVTNNHCLSSKESCNGTYISIFSGQSTVSAKCSAIVASASDAGVRGQKGIDFTVIRLDRSIENVRTLPVSRTRARPGQRLTAWVVDQIDNYKARITELNCHYSSRKRSMQLEGCSAISGNSGSPVVNDMGEVVGIIWGSTTEKSSNKKRPLEERRNLRDFSFATELRYFRKYLNL